MKAATRTKAIVLVVTTTPAVLGLLFGGVKIKGGEQTGAPAADQEEKASEFFGAFPAKSYASFEEAEQAARYHIPRASSDYPVALGVTHLQWFPQFERPSSETHYIYPALPSTYIYVIVRPSYFSSDPSDWTRGRATTVGGKSGWIPPEDDMFYFNYPCGEVDGYEVWCYVRADKEIGWEAFDHFVSTLE